MNSIDIWLIKQIGGEYILGNVIRKTPRGITYQADLYIGDEMFDIVIVKYWSGAGKVIKATDHHSNDKLVELEDRVEEYLKNNESTLQEYSKAFAINCIMGIVQLIGVILLIYYTYYYNKTATNAYLFGIIASSIISIAIYIARQKEKAQFNKL